MTGPVHRSVDMSVDDAAPGRGRMVDDGPSIPRASVPMREPVRSCGQREDDHMGPDQGEHEVVHDPQALLPLLPRDHISSVEGRESELV